MDLNKTVTLISKKFDDYKRENAEREKIINEKRKEHARSVNFIMFGPTTQPRPVVHVIYLLIFLVRFGGFGFVSVCNCFSHVIIFYRF